MVDNCLQNCSLCKRHTPRKVPMWVGSRYRDRDRRVLIVGEAPGKLEYGESVPFVGLSGKLLNAALNATMVCPYTQDSMSRNWFAITNCVKCWPHESSAVVPRHGIIEADKSPDVRTRNIKPDAEMQANCMKWLEQDIREADPHVILAFGKTAHDVIYKLWADKNTHDLALSDIWRFHHPSYILRSGGVKSAKYAQWVEEIRKAVNE